MSRRRIVYGSQSSSSNSSSDENDANTDTNRLLAFWENALPFVEHEDRTYIYRDREAAHQRLMSDYFNLGCTYGPDIFRQRYRMSKSLFLDIMHALESNYSYFRNSWDGRGRPSFTPHQKCTSALRQLAYGTIPDACDEYLRMSTRVSRETLDNFCSGVIQLFGPEYLRKPTASDVQSLYAAHLARHGFPGMLGSIDCTHWEWRNCPVRYRGQYVRGDHGYPTVMLEAVASQDLWIWHAFFGAAGANNDINVYNMSPLNNNILDGTAPDQSFSVNGCQYKYGYYLADGIYPNEPIFMKAYSFPDNPQRERFKRAQEAARKDVERAFGVLKARFAVVNYPARPTRIEKMRRIMQACVILHNMILKNEDHVICEYHEDEVPAPVDGFQENVEAYAALHNESTFHNLRQDLVTHIAEQFIPGLDG